MHQTLTFIYRDNVWVAEGWHDLNLPPDVHHVLLILDLLLPDWFNSHLETDRKHFYQTIYSALEFTFLLAVILFESLKMHFLFFFFFFKWIHEYVFFLEMRMAKIKLLNKARPYRYNALILSVTFNVYITLVQHVQHNMWCLAFWVKTCKSKSQSLSNTNTRMQNHMVKQVSLATMNCTREPVNLLFHSFTSPCTTNA